LARIGIVGCGSVGARAARQLLASERIDRLVLSDTMRDRARSLAHSLGPRAAVARDVRDHEVDGVVLAADAGTHFPLARDAVAAGRFVVSTGDALDDVRLLQTLDRAAVAAGRAVVLGAGFAPGLTCLLARLGAGWFDAVDELHVAKVGTGGPACARQHHRAFRGMALDWRDGTWVQRRGGSGRELCWFPEPIGGRDCYRAELADTVLLVDAFPGVSRVTTRVAATRRDRLTMQLPMLSPPHAEGGVGAVRVELRGRAGTGTRVVVLGAIDRPGVAAGSVAAQTCLWVLDGRIAPGARGLAETAEAKPFLRELADRGVKAAIFDGTPRRHALPEPLTAG
jgi:hypothetical protein